MAKSITKMIERLASSLQKDRLPNTDALVIEGEAIKVNVYW
jgi:hypothetical protein